MANKGGESSRMEDGKVVVSELHAARLGADDTLPQSPNGPRQAAERAISATARCEPKKLRLRERHGKVAVLVVIAVSLGLALLALFIPSASPELTPAQRAKFQSLYTAYKAACVPPGLTGTEKLEAYISEPCEKARRAFDEAVEQHAPKSLLADIVIRVVFRVVGKERLKDAFAKGTEQEAKQ